MFIRWDRLEVIETDEREFLQNLQPCQGRLYRTALAITGQEADAADALQEAVEQAWRKRNKFRGDTAAFGAWMVRITANRCLNMLRSRRRVTPFDPAGLPEPQPLPSLTPTQPEMEIWDAVRNLEPGQRQVVALRYLADLTLEMIADQLEIPIGTAKSRLSRALARLQSGVAQAGATADPGLTCERRVTHEHQSY